MIKPGILNLSMLTFRRFDFAWDAQAWSDAYNVSYGDWPDHVPMTPERIRWWMEAPSNDPESLWMAEDGAELVGIVEMIVDAKREERKGFIGDIAVLPNHRRRGFGRELFREAQRRLKARGMQTVEAWLWDGAAPALSFAESEGCKAVRSSCYMQMPLGGWSEKSAPTRAPPAGLAIRESDMSGADVALQNRLDNEGFREHYNFRPQSIDETEYKLLKDPNIERVGMHFAEMGGEPIGYVVTSADRKHHELTGKWRGYIMDIAVLKPHRKAGIGEALIRRGLARLKSIGMERAMLGVDEMNQTGAMRLYTRVGFTVKTRFIAFQKAL